MRFEDWIGRAESRTDIITTVPIQALSATLDRDDPTPRSGDPLPLLWHWLFFLPLTRSSALGEDGHERLGSFLPPVSLPRRMYAGGQVDVHGPLVVGDALQRASRIVDVREKSGRSGPLVFVKVRHEISSAAGLALVEDHDIVYRGVADGADPAGPRVDSISRPADPQGVSRARLAQPTVAGASGFGDAAENRLWRREVMLDEVLLFRYSALTFNAYRLHYDWPFAKHVQGYPGLVVHAPLVATLLADLLRREMPAAVVQTFSFRAQRPLFSGERVVLRGRPSEDEHTVQLSASRPNDEIAFEATAVLR